MFEADPEFAHRLIAPRIAYLVGTRNEKGTPNLVPISSITSVSREPQLVVIAVYKKWRTFANLQEAKGFTISVPLASQLEGVWKLAEKYSHFKVPEGKTKLEASDLPIKDFPDWYGPIIQDTIGYINCKIIQQAKIEADHGIFFGEVKKAVFNGEYLTKEGLYKKNSKPLMQVAKNSFTTSSEHWTIPFYDE